MELLASLKLGRVWGLQNFLVRGGTWSKGADMHGLRRAMSQRGRCVMMSGTSTHQESLPRRTPCPIVENRPFWPQKSFLWSASSLYAESFGYCSFGSNLAKNSTIIWRKFSILTRNLIHGLRQICLSKTGWLLQTVSCYVQSQVCAFGGSAHDPKISSEEEAPDQRAPQNWKYCSDRNVTGRPVWSSDPRTTRATIESQWPCKTLKFTWSSSSLLAES